MTDLAETAALVPVMLSDEDGMFLCEGCYEVRWPGKLMPWAGAVLGVCERCGAGEEEGEDA